MNQQAIRVLLAPVFALFVVGIARAETLQVDDAMYLDPGYEEVPAVLSYTPALKAGWLKALRRPEPELKRLAADTLVIARRMGMTGLEDTTDELLAVLKAPIGEQSLQRAIAHALVEFDARAAAELLFERSQDNGVGFGQVVEPALGRWGYQPMLAVWRKRLAEPAATPRSQLMLAIHGLGAAGDQEASESLKELVTDQRAQSAVRLSAARALALANSEGLVALSRELAADQETSSPVNRLLAASLLARHDDSDAIAMLTELASGTETVVVARAMGRLFEIDPKFVFELAAEAIQSNDVQVRQVGVKALIQQGDTEAVELLAPLLDDHNPSLRRSVASGLFDLAAREELHGAVVVEVTKMLAGEAWRGVEQACLVLGSLDHKPSWESCVELLADERDEIAISAAWALRRLKIPESLPHLLTRAKLVKDMFDGVVKPPDAPSADGLSAQLSQLMQAFGEMRYKEADALLKLMVPKKFIYGGAGRLMPDPRAAAIWSLGHLYEGQAPEALSRQLASRLKDQDILVPEIVNVRRQAGVSLGRMQSKAHLGDLREMAGGGYIGQGAYWGIERITGEPIPAVDPQQVDQVDWFLSPLVSE